MDEIYTSTATPTDCGGSDLIKARIATHPLYPTMLSAYIECQKIGAPPEMASLLQEMVPHNCPATSTSSSASSTTCTKIGDDPELDHFMETYCNILVGYKQELSKPFQEASTFLTNIQTQLNQICTGFSTTTISDDATWSSDEELSCGDIESSDGQESLGPHPGEQELKNMLMRKYSGYLISLRKDFLNKKKKGKLPKNARTTLLDWWNSHYRWPYPTEEDKIKLAEMTGLDQKQINNWFINQRKRHWRPSEDMRCALIEGVNGSGGSVFNDNIG